MNPSASSHQATLDLSHVSATLLRRLPFSSQFDRCESLAGDASNRRYYRLHLSRAPVPSVILMQLADPEGFKASEEAVSGAGADITELPFINILKHLQACGSIVPTLYYYDEAGGLLYLEDFGDLTLAQACRNSSCETIESWYRQAVDQLVHLHLHASHPSESCVAFTRSFDVPLYMWEFDHFLEYGMAARQGLSMKSEDAAAVREEFGKMAQWLAAQPRVFSHRDYHSRNLMVHDKRLGIIDFQDALMGPVTYDLASLLRDAYIALDESLIDRLINRYRDGMSQGLPVSQHKAFLLNDAQAFRQLFDVTSIQRNLKAAGRFVYIHLVKHNPNFLGSIPQTLQNVYKNLTRYPQYHRLLRHLSPYIPEWQ